MKFKKLIAKSILTTVICLSIFTAPLISQTCVHNHPSLEQNTINEHAKSTNDDTDGKLSLSFANGHSSLSKANDVITIIAQLRGGLDPDAITWNIPIPENTGVVENKIDNTTVRLEATLDIVKSQTFSVSASIDEISDSVEVKLIAPSPQPSIELSFANGRNSLSNAGDVITIIAQLLGDLDPNTIAWNIAIPDDTGVTKNMIDNTTVRLEATLDITKSQTFTVSASIASASDSLVVKLIPPEIQSIELSFANERDSLSKAKDVITIIAQLRGGLNPTNITWNIAIPDNTGVVENKIDNATVRLEATLDITKSQTFTVSASIASASDSLVVKLIPPDPQSIELFFTNELDSLSSAGDVITIIAQLRGGLNPSSIKWNIPIPDNTGVVENKIDNTTVRLEATLDIAVYQTFTVSASIGSISDSVLVVLMPQAGPTPIINLSYVNDKTTLMIQNDAVTIHADVTNFDPELLIWTVGDEGNLPDLNVTTTIDKNNITFKLLKNVNCDDLSINVTASYNDVKNQLPLNIKKLSLALTKTGKDFIRQRGDAITVTASSNYFDLAALPLTWEYDSAKLNSYGIKIEKIGMFEIKFIAENDIIVPEEEIAITCIVYDSKSSVDIQVTDATPIVRLSIKGENSILADIGDTVTIDAEIVSKEMMSSVWEFNKSLLVQNGIVVVENSDTRLVLKATSLINVNLFFKISMSLDGVVYDSLNISLQNARHTTLFCDYLNNAHLISKKNDRVDIQVRYYSPEHSNNIVWNLDENLLKSYGIEFETNNDILTLTATRDIDFSSQSIGSVQIPIEVLLDDASKTVTVDLSDSRYWIPTEFLSIDDNGVLNGLKNDVASLSPYRTLYIPPNVKLIADSAFDKDLGISTLPDNITSLIFPDDSECMEIGSFAFARTNFLSLRLPTKMQTIKNYGFGLCLNLTDVIFNEQLSELDPLSFTNDFALRNVYINNDQNIIQIGTADMTGNPFFGTNDQLKIFAPIVLKYDYENARSWNQLGLNFNFVR